MCTYINWSCVITHELYTGIYHGAPIITTGGVGIVQHHCHTTVSRLRGRPKRGSRG